MNNIFLIFSDAAKYANVARSLVIGNGYNAMFHFFGGAPQILPVMPLSIEMFFKLFGVNDFAVIATSFFYFLLTLIFVFLLSKKVFKSSLIGILSTVAVGFNYDLINYATSGASESPFIFEIVAASYFVSVKKKWANIAALLLLVLMYFTRPQAFIYIAGIILFYLLMNFKMKKAWIYFGIICFLGLMVDRFVLAPLSGKFFLYSILGRGSNVLSQLAVGQSASDQLRSGTLTYSFSIAESLKKVFYDLYNFYKLLPQIINPYLFALFAVGLFIPSMSKKEEGQGLLSAFKISSFFMVVATFIVTAASIPFFRYIHPVVPFIYTIAVGTLVSIINYQLPMINGFSIFNFQFSKQQLLIFSSSFLVLLFGVGQTLGVILLDSRYNAGIHNVGKPPVYVVLSQVLKQNTSTNQTVVTNLDTWGSWYGERKTIWYPLTPKQLIDPATGSIPFDAIYLTSYLIDDQNYYMGADWRQIFDNPQNPSLWTCDGCSEISKEFRLAGTYSVGPDQDYERMSAKAVLFVRK